MDKPTPLPASATPEEQDAYAQSLLRMVAMDYEKQQSQKPVQKHIFSKKRLVFLAVSTVLSIVLLWAISLATRHSGNSSQVIDSTKTFNDPTKY